MKNPQDQYCLYTTSRKTSEENGRYVTYRRPEPARGVFNRSGSHRSLVSGLLRREKSMKNGHENSALPPMSV